MKKSIVFAAALTLLPALAVAQDWDRVRIGVEGAYPPFSETKPDGSVVGFDIDIANALCEEIGARCTMVTQDWDGMIPALLARKYDAIIASMSITSERKKRVAFTKKYYSSPARFIKKSAGNIVIDKGRMSGLKVGVQQETAMDYFVTDNFGDVVEVRRYPTQEDANNDMGTGRLDLLFSELGPGDEFIKSRGGGYEFVGPSYTDQKWFGEGIGIAVRKHDQNLRRKLNRAIAAIRANGIYKRIQNKYFDYDIYGK